MLYTCFVAFSMTGFKYKMQYIFIIYVLEKNKNTIKTVNIVYAIQLVFGMNLNIKYFIWKYEISLPIITSLKT